MLTVRTISELQSISDEQRAKAKKLALVPTMGYFHQGHLSLIKYAAELSDFVITSLFVNPTQFAPHEDFDRYPRDIERDTKLASESGSDVLFMPDITEMYPDGFNCEINIGGVSKMLEGIYRPTHFTGVATVVSKLFNAAKPHIAIFGQKDYQQTLLIKKLVKDLNYDIEIVILPTYREKDGLAMSSRNVYLNADRRNEAGIIFRTLEEVRLAIEQGERNRKIINAIMQRNLRAIKDIKIDYACALDAHSLQEADEFIPGQKVVLLIAVYLGKIRLIDNMVIKIPENK